MLFGVEVPIWLSYLVLGIIGCLLWLGLSGLLWCVAFWTKNKFLRLDVDARLGFGDKGGVDIFVFFAGFVAAQQTLLGIASKGRGAQLWLAALIFALSVVTVFGEWRCLGLTISKDGPLRRAFDRPTIAFGRWVLIISTLLGMIVPALAAAGLLPGQEVERVRFTKKQLATVTEKLFHRVPRNPEPGSSFYKREEAHSLKWLNWPINCGLIDHDSQFVWIESESFANDFESFTAEIEPPDNVTIIERLAFLRKIEPGLHYRPTLRPLRFHLEKGTKETNTLEVFRPKGGEVLWLILRTEGVLPKDPVFKVSNPDGVEDNEESKEAK